MFDLLSNNINKKKLRCFAAFDLLSLGEECRDYDDSPCNSCCRRFHCPNNDPEEPEYCSWYLTRYTRNR